MSFNFLVHGLAVFGALALVALVAASWLERHRHDWNTVRAAKVVEEWSLQGQSYRGSYDLLVECSRCGKLRRKVTAIPTDRTVWPHRGVHHDVLDLLERYEPYSSQRKQARQVRAWLGEDVVVAIQEVPAHACGKTVRGYDGAWVGYCLLRLDHPGDCSDTALPDLQVPTEDAAVPWRAFDPEVDVVDGACSYCGGGVQDNGHHDRPRAHLSLTEAAT